MYSSHLDRYLTFKIGALYAFIYHKNLNRHSHATARTHQNSYVDSKSVFHPHFVTRLRESYIHTPYQRFLTFLPLAAELMTFDDEENFSRNISPCTVDLKQTYHLLFPFALLRIKRTSVLYIKRGCFFGYSKRVHTNKFCF
jgi:hypothetical protein